MRLIDADKLHYSRIRIAHSDGTIGGYNAVVMSVEIKDAPTVDAMPVVRCKDCKHRYKMACHMAEFYECSHIGMASETGNITHVGVTDDFFCADGERRTK